MPLTKSQEVAYKCVIWRHGGKFPRHQLQGRSKEETFGDYFVKLDDFKNTLFQGFDK